MFCSWVVAALVTIGGVYQADVPDSWTHTPHEPKDSRDPIHTFLVDKEVKVTIHKFPNHIPPSANVARWDRQSKGLSHTQEVAWGGFIGLYFEADGVMAWSMQLDPEHLQRNPHIADYTIKAVGESHHVAEHKQSMITFSESFELVDELP